MGGLRWPTKLAGQVEANYLKLDAQTWRGISEQLQALTRRAGCQGEREAALLLSDAQTGNHRRKAG